MNTGANGRLAAARTAKKDEFYTQLADIERELRHYREHFEDKVVYLNCDDPRVSDFSRYFLENAHSLGLKRLIATGYAADDPRSCDSPRGAVRLDMVFDKARSALQSGEELDLSPHGSDGDFRSTESIELLQQADIVVTNPPFSLFREYVAQLMEHGKKFIILGNMNALTYKEIFPLFQQNRIWYGPSIRSGDREFRVPDDYPLEAAGTRTDAEGRRFIRVKGVRWFTNIDYAERHEGLQLTKRYSASEYPRYVNFDAIEVGKTAEIPADYDGLMGVPITFIDKYNPDQFEIVGSSKTMGRPMSEFAEKGTYQEGGPRFYLPTARGYRRMYDRIVVRNRRLQAEGRGSDGHVLSLSR